MTVAALPSVTSPASRTDSRKPSLTERALALFQAEVEFIPNPEFTEETDLTESIELVTKLIGNPSSGSSIDLPAHLARLCEVSLLDRDEEREVFRTMNYLKFQVDAIRNKLDAERPNADQLALAEKYLRLAKTVRDHIVEANMRLAISVVKKFVTPQHSFDDLLSDAIFSMMHAVEKFDFDRGFRFSTYAYRAIAHGAYRTISDRQRQNSRYQNGADSMILEVEDGSGRGSMDEQTWEALRGLLMQAVDQLDRREQFIIRGRYALGAHRKTKSFQSLADKLGVSKERVRQLEQRAVSKIRSMTAQFPVDDMVQPALV